MIGAYNIFVIGAFLAFVVGLSGVVSTVSGVVVYIADDGTGDYNCNGITDEIELRNATSYVNSTGGGTVHIKANTICVINDTVYIYDNMTFEGEGQTSVLRMSETALESDDCGQTNRETCLGVGDGATIRMIDIYNISGQNNFTIRNFFMNGSELENPNFQGGKNGSIAINIRSSDNVTISSVDITDVEDGILSYYTNNILIENNQIYNLTHDGIRVGGQDNYNITIKGNTLGKGKSGESGPTGGGFGAQCLRILVSNVTVIDNYCSNPSDYGFAIYAGFGLKVQNLLIKNNTLRHVGYGGQQPIFLWNRDTGEGIFNVTIENNIIADNNNHAIEIYDQSGNNGIDDIFIINNVIDGTGLNKDGIYLLSGTGGNITDVIIKNNIIMGTDRYGINANCCEVNSTYNLIYNSGIEDYNGTVNNKTGDIYTDPLFFNTSNYDFYIKSISGRWNGTDWVTDYVHSPAIDAGDPGSDHSNEPSYPDGRINIGAFGNTIYASKNVSSTGTVLGKVTEINGSGIHGATVSIGSITNTTNYTGDYVLLDVLLGNSTITASLAGYYDNSTGVNVVANSTTIKNIVLTRDEEPPDITFFPPTPDDGDNVSSSYIYINVNLSEAADWIALEWNGTNESMQGSDTSWYRNMTGLANGQYSFKVWTDDSAGNMNVSETRSVTVNYVSSIDTDLPSIDFTDLTPVDGTVTGNNHVYVNTSISDESGVSSFIDWNRSLAGYWRFEEDAGGTARDSSPNGNNGTIHGAVSSDGKFGKALNFDGNDYVEIENPDLNLTNEITIEAWVRPILGSNMAIVARYVYNYGIPVDDRSFALRIRGDGIVQFALSSDGTGSRWLTSNEMVNDNAWNHIVAISDGTTMRIYINGVQDTETKPAPSIIHSPDRPMQIGAWIYGVANETDNEYFNGIIDEVKIHSRALSQQEINASYDSKLYNLERNFTSLDNGNYSYYACAQDTAGNYNCTETRVVTVRFYSQPLFEGWNNITEFIGYNNTPVKSSLSSVDYTIIWELDNGSNSTKWSHVKGVGGDFSNLTSGEAYRIYVNSSTTWTYPVP